MLVNSYVCFCPAPPRHAAPRSRNDTDSLKIQRVFGCVSTGLDRLFNSPVRCKNQCQNFRAFPPQQQRDDWLPPQKTGTYKCECQNFKSRGVTIGYWLLIDAFRYSPDECFVCFGFGEFGGHGANPTVFIFLVHANHVNRDYLCRRNRIQLL